MWFRHIRNNCSLTRVFLLALLLSLASGCQTAQSRQQQEEAKARYQTAKAMFKERCKKAGYFIHKTVDDVEGIFLMKIRPKGINYGKQYRMDDPYGRDLGGEGYIETFIQGSYPATHRGTPAPGSPTRIGYQRVEAVDPTDGVRYQYKGAIKTVEKKSSVIGGGNGRTKFKVEDYVIDKTTAVGPSPRYGVTYDDISTREERDYWIAGSSLKVIDLETNELLAERIGYMWDPGQGNNSGGRSPWLKAANYACPGFQSNPLRPIPRSRGSSAQRYQTLDFVEKVLKPKLGEKQ